MPWIIGGLALGGDLLGGMFGGHSQAKANKANIKLQREQQAWEKDMSNTAVQRRVKDITAAGGNPALAFESGSSASTPSISPAQVQPEFDKQPFNFTSKILDVMQMKTAKAMASSATSKAKMDKIDADLYAGEAGIGNLKWQQLWKENGLLSEKIDKARSDAEISKYTADLIKEKNPILLRQLEAATKLGELNTESAEAIARTLGVAAKDVGTVARLFIEMAKLLMTSGGVK